jgi:hypothetical protein
VAEVVEIRPAKGERLVPSATIKQLLQRAAFHGCREAVADQHYIESVREHANGFMVIEAPGGLEGKTIAYLAARTAISEGRVRIPAVQTRLIQQLREVISKPTPGGNLTISSPRRGGSHGDIASSFVLGVWASSRDRVIGYPKLHRANVGITADWGNGTPYRRTYGPGGSHDWETGKPIRQSRRGRFG